ncbi:MAG TPA: cytochrome C oxidase subunit II [Myxococcales bacterium]|nr:cytochrome C oxidase subunit II [Myxococcales bacterium]
MKLQRILTASWKPLAAGALALSTVALAAVQPETGIGLPRDVSLHGHLSDWLTNVTHVFNIILFTIMCVWMGIACFKHGRAHQAEYDLGDDKRSIKIALMLSAVIFVVVDGNLFVNAINDIDNAYWNFDEVDQNPATVRIEVNAHQWAWDGRYAGKDGRFNTEDDVLVWNDFKVPEDTPVYFQLASTDVIHSFYLPNFRAKMDAVPGQVNHMWIQARQGTQGDYDIGCAQHCGTHHYKMKGQLSVLSKDEYQKWLNEASVNGLRAFDATDGAAHWGWDWKKF